MSYEDMTKEALKKKLEEAQEKIYYLENQVSLADSADGISHEINNNISLVLGFVSAVENNAKTIHLLFKTHQKIMEGILGMYQKCIALQEKLEEDPTQNKELIAQKATLYDQLSSEIRAYMDDNNAMIDIEEQEELNEINDDLVEAAGAIRYAFNQIHEISENIRNIGSQAPHVPQKVNVTEILEYTLLVAKNNIDDTIQIRKNLKYVPHIDSFKGKLNQVFTNLIKNAFESILQKEALGDDEFIQVDTHQEGDNLIVKIADSGIGMSEQTQKHLYKEFFTTKGAKGTGLGMGICRSIVEKHQGSIVFVSELGKGTEFTITLPINLS